MKLKIIGLLCCVMVFTSAGSVSAGIPVIDGTNLSSAILRYVTLIIQYATQVKQYTTQITNLSNQYKQLSNEAQNLTKLNYKLDLSGFNEVQQIMKNAQGIAGNYAKLQNLFDAKYPDFSKYSKMSGANYAAQARLWNDENKKSVNDAMRMQAKIGEMFNDDAKIGTDLSMKAASVQGARDGLQTIAQICVHQTKQLMQLQQLMSVSQRAESAFMAQKMSAEAAAKSKADKLYSGWTVKGARTVNTKIEKLH